MKEWTEPCQPHAGLSLAPGAAGTTAVEEGDHAEKAVTGWLYPGTVIRVWIPRCLVRTPKRHPVSMHQGARGCGLQRQCVQRTLAKSCSHPEDPRSPRGTRSLQAALHLLFSVTFPSPSSLPTQGTWAPQSHGDTLGWSHLETGIPSQHWLLAEGTGSAS